MNLNDIAVILRTWSNNLPAAAIAANRALECGVKRVIIVVKDEDPDHHSKVDAFMADERSFGAPITVLPMPLYYSWSNALNHGMEEVRRINLDPTHHTMIDYVLNVSNEVEYTEEDVQEMVERFVQSRKCGVVGVKFRARLRDGTPVELGKTYTKQCRNTMMLVSFDAYIAVGGFDPRCDALGGQEDLDWIVRAMEAGYCCFKLDREVPLIVGEHYNQAEKQERERAPS